MQNRPVFFDPTGRRGWWATRAGVTVATVLGVATALFLILLSFQPFLPPSNQFASNAARFRSVLPRLPNHESRLSLYLMRRERAALWNEINRSHAAEIKSRQRHEVSTSNEVVAAFYAPWEATGFNSLSANASKITHLMPEWLHLNAAGTAYTTEDFDFGLNPGNEDVLKVAADNHIQIFPVFSNAQTGDFDPDRVHKLFSSPSHERALANSLRDWLVKNNFEGLNVDFENLDDDDYARYPAFLAILKRSFDPDGLRLTMDAEASPDLPLDRISKLCDFVVLMAYDEHYDASPPGPIASFTWCESLMREALKQVPANKLVMGIGNYAYDWTIGSKDPAEPETYQSAVFAAKSHGQGDDPRNVVDFDPEALNSTFNYSDDSGNDHEVWMLDAVSAYNQWLLARHTNLRGGAMWSLGEEDPALWSFFDRHAAKVSPDGLKVVRFPYEVEFDGQGEILAVASQPQPGSRTVDIDPTTGICTDMEYESFPNPYVITRSGYKPGVLALTFDDGPDPEWTPEILDELKTLGVHATFFMIGQNAERNPDLVRRVYDEGNEIGNHTFTHPNLGVVSQRRVELELNTTQRAIESITRHSTIMFRPPYNADAEPETGEEVRPVVEAAKLGYITVGEYIDPQDWNPNKIGPDGVSAVPRTVTDIVNGVLDPVLYSADTDKGNVILFHDAGGDRSKTVKALAIVVPILERDGYKFETISQLLGRKRSDMMPPITGREELVVGFDRWMFTLIFGSEWLLATGFVLAIFLGFARVALVMPLAVLGAFLERRRVFDPDYQPFVSVLIAAYNEAPVIERTISSILNSSYTNLEVVVVDDGSQDGTGEVVQRVFGSDSRVVIRRQTNGGKASALNRAIAESHGEIFVGFDADTQVAADAIALLVRHFHNPKVGAVAGNVKVGNRVNLITRWQALEYVTSQNLDRRAYGVLNAITVVPGAIGAWRRSAVLGVGGYMADTLAEDMDLTWRLRRAGWRLETDTQAMAYTEAPDTFGAFFKQRFRWTYGTLQCLYKHRKALGRYGWFGWLALPQIWIFQIILQVLAPFVDFQLLYGLLGVATSWLAQGYYHDIWQPDQSSVALLQRTAFFYAVFYCCELLGSALAFRLDRERWSLLLWLFWQRFVYRQLLYGVVWKALWTALIGFRQGWGKLARKGTVNLPVARTASPAPREEGT